MNDDAICVKIVVEIINSKHLIVIDHSNADNYLRSHIVD